MKKLIFVVPLVLLLLVGCECSNDTPQQKPKFNNGDVVCTKLRTSDEDGKQSHHQKVLVVYHQYSNKGYMYTTRVDPLDSGSYIFFEVELQQCPYDEEQQ